MSEVIEVKDVPGLGQYSVALESYANAVQSAGDQTERSFSTKIEGSKAEAITAFLGRLNILQEQVFNQAPNTLKQYSNIVDAFEGVISGAGFRSRAKTSSSGVSSVATKLEVDQVTEMESTQSSLQVALDRAAGLLGIEAPNLSQPTREASQDLTQSASDRKKTHTQIEEGNTTFKTGLEGILASLESYLLVVRNAKAVSSVGATYMFDQIKQGRLTSENMDYISRIQNNADVEVMKLVLEGRLEDIGQIQEKAVTAGGYRILSDEVIKWVSVNAFEEFDKDKNLIKPGPINILFGALGKIPQGRAEHILKQMLFAGDAHAIDIITLQEFEYNQNGQRLDTEAMIALNNQMRTVNRYNGLVNTLLYLKHGQLKVKVSTDSDREVTVDNIIHIRDAGLDNIEVLHYNLPGAMKGVEVPIRVKDEDWHSIYTSELETSYAGYVGAQVESRLTAIELERREAKIEYVKTVLTSLATLGAAGANLFSPLPGLTGLVSIANKVILGQPGHAGIDAVDQSGFRVFQPGRHQDPELSALAHQNGIDSLNSMLDLFVAHKLYEQKNQEMTEKELEELKNLRKTIIGGGGWVLSGNGREMATSTDNYHDFRIHMRTKELDTNGIMSYLKEHKISPEKYRKILETNDISKEIQDYLLGVEPDPEKGKVSIQQMNLKQLQDVETGMDLVSEVDPTDTNKMIDAYESIINDLNARYNPKSGK